MRTVEVEKSMNRRQFLAVLALLLVLLGIWGGLRLSGGTGNIAQDYLEIRALSVGKADALIILEGEQVLLIDAGEKDDGDVIVEELKRRGIRQIDLFLISHFDKDHVGGASYVMEQMEVSAVLLPDYEGDRPEYREFLEHLDGHPDVQRVAAPLEMVRGGMQITVYPAEDPAEIQNAEDEYDNDMSLVTSITYGSRKFLFTGDIEKSRIRQMLASDVDWSHDWIKMPHHGRYQKALEDLLEAVAPSGAVICCSEKNPAEEETRKLLEELQIQVWDTADRAVVTVCDGEQVTVRNE